LRLSGIRLPTDAEAWKLFAFQQTINSTLPFLIITWAQQYVPAANTVVLASTTPIFAFVITWGITRHEPATLLKLAGAVMGLAGTAVIIELDALGGLGSNIFAELAILLATISFACATIFGLRLSDYHPMVVAAGSLLFGGLILLPPALIVDQPWTLRPSAQALMATATMGIFSSALGLMVPDPARYPHHQRARLSAHSHWRRIVGAPARRNRAVEPCARTSPRHGRRSGHDDSQRSLQCPNHPAGAKPERE
jgi:drug/metabolite transporter (DMT)-like permease